MQLLSGHVVKLNKHHSCVSSGYYCCDHAALSPRPLQVWHACKQLFVSPPPTAVQPQSVSQLHHSHRNPEQPPSQHSVGPCKVIQGRRTQQNSATGQVHVSGGCCSSRNNGVLGQGAAAVGYGCTDTQAQSASPRTLPQTVCSLRAATTTSHACQKLDRVQCSVAITAHGFFARRQQAVCPCRPL